MKTIGRILIIAFMCIISASCASAPYLESDDIYVTNNDDITIIMKQGAPYYDNDGYIMYILYNADYYYPYWHYDRYIFHCYHRPLGYTTWSRWYKHGMYGREWMRTWNKPYHRPHKPNHRYNRKPNHKTHNHHSPLRRGENHSTIRHHK